MQVLGSYLFLVIIMVMLAGCVDERTANVCTSPGQPYDKE